MNFIKTEIQLINIFIGCKIRLERLRKNLSQHDVGVASGTDNTAVGRVERAEHISNWSSIFLICQYLEIEFCSLFLLKPQKELLLIVEECYLLEKKLTKDKEKYYTKLKERIKKLYSQIQ